MLTSLDAITQGQSFPPFSEFPRLDRYRTNKMLFDNKAQAVWVDWARRLEGDQGISMMIALNYPQRLSKLWADMLFGETPRITVYPETQENVTDMTRMLLASDFWNVSYQVALDVSRYGTGIYKLWLDGVPRFQAIPPHMWFPIINPNNMHEVVAHVIAWLSKDTDNSGDNTLLMEIHTAGKIEYKAFKMHSGIISEEITDLVYDKREEETGVPIPLIFPVHNINASDTPIGQDDYEAIEPILYELNQRLSQISRILNKHSDPHMAGPETALEQDEMGRYVFRGGAKYFPLEAGDPMPQYITWDGKLQAAFDEIKFLVEQLFVISEVSPVLFGLSEGSLRTGASLRKELIAPISKSNRLRMRFDPVIRNMLLTAGALWNKKWDEINVSWQEGLPINDLEQAQIYTMLYKTGLVSQETAVKKLFSLDSQTLNEELSKINQSATVKKGDAATLIDNKYGIAAESALNAVQGDGTLNTEI